MKKTKGKEKVYVQALQTLATHLGSVTLVDFSLQIISPVLLFHSALCM